MTVASTRDFSMFSHNLLPVTATQDFTRRSLPVTWQSQGQATENFQVVQSLRVNIMNINNVERVSQFYSKLYTVHDS